MKAIFIDGPMRGAFKEFPNKHRTIEWAIIKPIQEYNLDNPTTFPRAENITYNLIAETTIPGVFVFSIKEESKWQVQTYRR